MRNLYPIAYDTETTGLDRERHSMFAYSTDTEDGDNRVIRMDGKDKSNMSLALKKLKALFDRKDKIFVMHNAKFDIGMTERKLDRKMIETLPFHDTMRQSHIIQSDHRGHGLKNLAWEIANIPTDDEKDIKPFIKNPDGETDYSCVPPHLMKKYAGRDAMRTILLHMFFYPKIEANPKWLECYNTEIDVIRVALRMEERGLTLHHRNAIALRAKMHADAETVLNQAEQELGERFDLGNNNVIRRILYDRLRMPVKKVTGKSGQASVDKDALADMKENNPHPILDLILQYKSWKRGVTTMDSYLELADEYGVIHPNMNTCQAATARQSCSNPNLQNVEKDGKLLNPYPVPARMAFKPRQGYVNFHMDYKGIQFRLAVIRTGDPVLIDMVMRDVDLHVVGAKLLFGSKWDKGTKEQQKIWRNASKNGNFAKMFGAGYRKVCQVLGFEIPIANWNEYETVFAPLDRSSRQIVEFAKHHGYTETTFGRRLWVPRHKPYAATNYAIQGDEAEIVKRAMIRANKVLNDLTGGEACLILSVHDEIVIEYPRTRLQEALYVLGEVRKVIIDFPIFDAPLEVDVEISTRDWSKKEAFTL